MKKIILVNKITPLANSQDGRLRFTLQQDRATHCRITLAAGETADALPVKVGDRVVAIEETHNTSTGEQFNAFFYMNVFSPALLAQEASNDYDFQLKLLKTRALTAAQTPVSVNADAAAAMAAGAFA